MQEVSIIKLNKADKPYQLLILKDDTSAQIFKIQLDKNLLIDKTQTEFDSEDDMEVRIKKQLDIKGTVPNEILMWCQQNNILKKIK